MDKLKGNLWVHKTAHDFSSGFFHNTILTESEKGSIVLNKKGDIYDKVGTYASNVIYTSPFEYMVLSWNADTPEGTSIKLEVQVLVSKDGALLWSKWLPYALWSTTRERCSVGKSISQDNFAYIDTDTLIIKGTSGEKAVAVRYRLTLATLNLKNTPSIRLISGTTRNALSHSNTVEELSYNESNEIPKIFNKTLEIPRFSQMIRDPRIAGVMCSPTSLTMILNYYGKSLIPEETAWSVYDTIYEGFGNWPFNTAFAGSLGFEAYICYCNSIYDLKREIYNGYPVVVSVKYKNSESEEATLPLIRNAPISKTNGHLIVVCGFETVDEKEYVVVNDPAAASDETVRLRYVVDEFNMAWTTSGKATYIIHPIK